MQDPGLVADSKELAEQQDSRLVADSKQQDSGLVADSKQQDSGLVADLSDPGRVCYGK